MAKKKVIEQTKKTVADAIYDGKSEIESLKEEMDSWKDNMEEKLSQTPKYEEVSAVCDSLENVVNSLEQMNELNSDVAAEEMHLTLSSKKKPSRNDRMSDAILQLDEAKSFIETRIETLENGIGMVEDKEEDAECPDCNEMHDSHEELLQHMADAHAKTDQIAVFDMANDEAVLVGKEEPDTDATLFTKESMEEEKENLDQVVSELGDAIDEANGINFPGMY